MGLESTSVSLKDLNDEVRLSVKHLVHAKELKAVLDKGDFQPLKTLLKSPPQYGSAQAGKDIEDEDDIRYIRITDIDSFGNLNLEDGKTAEKIESKYFLEHGDFLFARSGNTVGKSFLYDKTIHPEAIFAGYFIRFKIDFDKIDSKIFFYYTKSRIFELWKNATIRVMGQPNINAEEYRFLPVPVLSIETQSTLLSQFSPIELDIRTLVCQRQDVLSVINKIIAEELDFDLSIWREFGRGMTVGTQKLEVKPATNYVLGFDKLSRSTIFRFSSRFHNPKIQQLESILGKIGFFRVSELISERVKRGVQPKQQDDGEIIVIKTLQLKNSHIDTTQCELVSQEFYNKNVRAQVRKGDILLASTGKGSIGKIDVVEFDEEALVDGHISVIRLDEKKYNPLFFVYFFRSILGVFQMERDFTGATNQIELYAEQIENFIVPSISLSRQATVVTLIKKMLDEQNLLRESILLKQKQISELIESVLH